MTVTATPSRRRTIARVAGAAAAFAAAAVLTGGLLSGVGAGEAAAASADVHLEGESTTGLDESASAAKRRTTKTNTSDYLKVVLKEAG